MTEATLLLIVAAVALAIGVGIGRAIPPHRGQRRRWYFARDPFWDPGLVEQGRKAGKPRP